MKTFFRRLAEWFLEFRIALAKDAIDCAESEDEQREAVGRFLDLISRRSNDQRERMERILRK
jgi:hypothetical protein